MGWTTYGRSIADPQAECDRLCTWSNDHVSSRVVTSALVGNVYYAAVERTEAGGEPRTSAGVFLIQRSPFGYKDMDESMGPTESSCPRSVLEKLSPLPARDPKPCSCCDGAGTLQGERWAASAQGRECFSCDGQGSRDPHDYARNWRKRCWARFGGEPQGRQLELLVA